MEEQHCAIPQGIGRRQRVGRRHCRAAFEAVHKASGVGEAAAVAARQRGGAMRRGIIVRLKADRALEGTKANHAVGGRRHFDCQKKKKGTVNFQWLMYRKGIFKCKHFHGLHHSGIWSCAS